MKKVPVQKGQIISNQPTMKSKSYSETISDAKKEIEMRRDGQELRRMSTPKK